MSSTYRAGNGRRWAVDEVAPGGLSSISDNGMVKRLIDAISTTLVFRPVPDGHLRTASDVVLAGRDDEGAVARAFSESTALGAVEP